MLHYAGRAGYEVALVSEARDGSASQKRKGRPKKWGVGAATTQLAPRVLWSPGDARQYGQDVDLAWTELAADLGNCNFAGQSDFDADHQAWLAFYGSASDWTLWWNSGEIDSWQDTLNGWRDKVVAAGCGSNLAPGGASTALQDWNALASFAGSESGLKWIMLGVLALAVGWAALPALLAKVR
jgi:hypothetical protein